MRGLRAALDYNVPHGIVAFRTFAEDQWEAARRRVPLGADREAVEAAVGKAADGGTDTAGRTARCSATAGCAVREWALGALRAL
jgi:hypothetical protein